MTDETTEQHDFEHHLATLLQARADTIEVHPDLDAVAAATSVEPPRSRPAGRAWWLAAAAVVLAGGIGLSRLGPAPDGAVSTGSDSSPTDDAGDPTSAADTTALLVWLRPDATQGEIEELAGLLIDSPAVLEIRTMGRDGTVADLTDHFADHVADEPGSLRLIDPGNPPAAFRVVSDNPGDVGDLVTGLDGLDGVENIE
ncbi:MAG: hypothetical protein ACR2QK_01560 [Acidimicrobiales bacterium]